MRTNLFRTLGTGLLALSLCACSSTKPADTSDVSESKSEPAAGTSQTTAAETETHEVVFGDYIVDMPAAWTADPDDPERFNISEESGNEIWVNATKADPWTQEIWDTYYGDPDYWQSMAQDYYEENNGGILNVEATNYNGIDTLVNHCYLAVDGTTKIYMDQYLFQATGGPMSNLQVYHYGVGIPGDVNALIQDMLNSVRLDPNRDTAAASTDPVTTTTAESTDGKLEAGGFCCIVPDGWIIDGNAAYSDENGTAMVQAEGLTDTGITADMWEQMKADPQTFADGVVNGLKSGMDEVTLNSAETVTVNGYDCVNMSVVVSAQGMEYYQEYYYFYDAAANKGGVFILSEDNSVNDYNDALSSVIDSIAEE